jgi:Fe-S-cluster containining protein
LFIDAQARMNAVVATMRPKLAQLNDLSSRAHKASSTKAKVAISRQVVAIVADAVNGVAACKPACSQCCHIPVSLTQAEADVIGAEIGIEAAKPKYHTEADYTRTGTACRFLVDNMCSIYESRPIACRLCFNMDADALLCTLVEGEVIKVPYFNGIQFESVLLSALGMKLATKVAGLHEFFPIKG